MTDFSIDAKEFRQKFRPLRIVEPIEFLKIMAEKNLPLKPLKSGENYESGNTTDQN